MKHTNKVIKNFLDTMEEVNNDVYYTNKRNSRHGIYKGRECIIGGLHDVGIPTNAYITIPETVKEFDSYEEALNEYNTGGYDPEVYKVC